jgi:hypothetical protein
MNEYVIPVPTPQEIDKVVASLRTLLQLCDHLLWQRRDPHGIMDQFKSEEMCEREINNVMNDWTNRAFDPGLIVDQLSNEERANMYLTVVAPWIYPDSMRKLLDAMERPKNAAAEVACL